VFFGAKETQKTRRLNRDPQAGVYGVRPLESQWETARAGFRQIAKPVPA
jgi:hypothetical protein